MVIREYKPADFNDILAINDLSFEFPMPKLLLQAEIDNGKCWVATSGTGNLCRDYKVVGFIIGKLKIKIPYVYEIAVAESHRGQGIATKLFEKFEEHYGSLQKPENLHFWLEVDASNPAQKLYFDLGYRVVDIKFNYYGDYKHALCMHKSAQPICNLV